jgi:DNA phosphorothioation-associated putative methyltransferase
MKIKRENTAIGRKTPSVPTKWAKENGHIGNIVFDWGCGRGENSEYLTEKGHIVFKYDPFYFPDNDPETFDFSKIDTIICNYVLNVIEEPKERIELLRQIASKSVKNVILSVRSDINKLSQGKNWKPFNDGFITGSTFQKGYSKEELLAMQDILGSIVKIKSISSRIVAVFEKEI